LENIQNPEGGVVNGFVFPPARALFDGPKKEVLLRARQAGKIKNAVFPRMGGRQRCLLDLTEPPRGARRSQRVFEGD
jgi:hypothetical protein